MNPAVGDPQWRPSVTRGSSTNRAFCSAGAQLINARLRAASASAVWLASAGLIGWAENSAIVPARASPSTARLASGSKLNGSRSPSTARRPYSR